MPLPWHHLDSSTLRSPAPTLKQPFPCAHECVLVCVQCTCAFKHKKFKQNITLPTQHPLDNQVTKPQTNNDPTITPSPTCIEVPTLMPNPILTPCFPCPALQNKLFSLACSAKGFSVLDFVLQGLAVSGTWEETKYLLRRMKANVYFRKTGKKLVWCKPILKLPSASTRAPGASESLIENRLPNSISVFFIQCFSNYFT